MNNEVIKAMNKKENTYRIRVRKWWNNNSHYVFRVIFFPLWLVTLALEQYAKWQHKRQVWDTERAKEIFDYYIPRRAHWNEDEKTFYFFDNGCGWSYSSAKKYLKRKDRMFWKIHCGCFGGELKPFLIKEFELEGFTKELLDCADGWTEIVFHLN